MILDNRTHDVCKQIGEFYLAENQGNYEAAALEIMSIRFTDVLVFNDFIVVKVARPGLFIGSRGHKIDRLSIKLGKRIHVIEQETIEDCIVPYPEPTYPDEFLPDVSIPEPLEE